MKRKVPTVLIIDDDDDIRELMKIVLEGDGYRVNVAANGFDAFKQLETGSRPALILLDLMMPGMDGEEFLRKMHASGFAKIPVVIMSGYSGGQKVSRELYGVSCLMKPVELDELLKTVRRMARVAS
jgi:CheY-like chemotaxis protein